MKVHVRTTLIIEQKLVERVRERAGIQAKTALVWEGLTALIACESAKRLAALGVTQPKLSRSPRRLAVYGSCRYLPLDQTLSTCVYKRFHFQ